MLGAEVVNPMPANVQGATVCKKKGGAWHQRWCAGDCPNLESEG